MIELVAKNAAAIFASIKKIFLASSGLESIEDASTENILLATMAEVENHAKDYINETAAQTLVQYAKGENLDAIGAARKVTRNSAQPARAKMKITYSTATGDFIPKNTIFTDGTNDFIVETDIFCDKDETTVEFEAVAVTPGTAANGIGIGKINDFGQDSQGHKFSLPFIQDITNTIETYGGAEVETDEHYRQRIFDAIMITGTDSKPREAYRFLVMSHFPDIIDAQPVSDVPAEVHTYALIKNRAQWTPAQRNALISDIETYLNSEEVKFLCYDIYCHEPADIASHISVELTPFNRAGINKTQLFASAQQILRDYQSTVENRMGRDIVPARIVDELMKIDGVYSVTVTEPAGIVRIDKKEVALFDEPTVVIAEPVEEE